VPRLRFSSFVVGVAAVLLAGPAADAWAQNSAALLSPQLDGDPRRPQRFQRSKAPANARATATFQLDSAAGTTGFDSSGARKRKGGGKSNSKPGNKSVTPPSRVGALAAVPPPPSPPPRTLRGALRRGVPLSNVAAQTPGAPARRLAPLPDDAPFDPLGIQVGAFNFKPAIEVIGGYDTNPARTANRTPSLYAVVAPELTFKSNWSRHEFAGDLRGGYVAYRELPSQNRPNADSKLTGRIDVTRDTRVDLETRFLVGTDNPGSPNIQAGLSKLPIFTTLGGTAGLGQRFNRFDVSLKGGVDRTVYQQSTFTDGTSASNDDRNFNRYGTLLRGSYELTPAIKPFIEAGADRRVHDLEVDVFGYYRNSDGRSIKAGTTFELTRIITGEVALGWLTRRYQDPTLPEFSGLTFDASLTWVASALTTAKLTAVTRADESRVPGVSGVFTHEVALQVEHAFRRWLTATGKLLYGNDDYVGSPRDDNRYSASAAITYKLSRELWLKSEYRHDWLRSSTPGANYSADAILVGVRAQR
jgi:hypothetical protein